jgi:HAD superfamily hydrolase (TIGR01549 family)
VTEPAVILDVDGTLVDTNYHHALAWYRALRGHELTIPLWRIHRHIGMGGDQIVAALAGEDVDRSRGDEIRSDETEIYRDLIGEVTALPGARELVRELHRRGHRVVLSSSAKEWEVEHYVGLLDVEDCIVGYTTSADVERTKPHPDVIKAALEKLDGAQALMVGDSTFDCEAAQRSGVEIVAVLTGGFGEDELRRAGARAVYETAEALCDGLDGALRRA